MSPAFPSSHYRSQGMRPVYVWSMVLWVTPERYSWIRQQYGSDEIIDATEEQIASQDAWYEHEQKRLAEDHARLLAWSSAVADTWRL